MCFRYVSIQVDKEVHGVVFLIGRGIFPKFSFQVRARGEGLKCKKEKSGLGLNPPNRLRFQVFHKFPGKIPYQVPGI